jgi:hypothetical protein
MISSVDPQQLEFSDPDALYEEGGEILVDLAAFLDSLKEDDE